YELMVVLEVNAVEQSTYNKTLLKELKDINKEFEKATRAIDMLDYDRQFHQKLISTYPNKSAHSIIENLRVRVSLYDYAFWNEDQKMESIAMHDDIINFLEINDIASAVALLKSNWIQSIDEILSKLKDNITSQT
ncbi:MAG: FCD domain-containing protein, partial [Bacteroidota bacterium]